MLCIKCYASRSELGAALGQCLPTRWHAVLIATSFFNSNEERSIVNELELLGIVCSVEYFNYYYFGNNFTLIIDRRAFSLSTMKEHSSKKSCTS